MAMTSRRIQRKGYPKGTWNLDACTKASNRQPRVRRNSEKPARIVDLNLELNQLNALFDATSDPATKRSIRQDILDIEYALDKQAITSKQVEISMGAAGWDQDSKQ